MSLHALNLNVTSPERIMTGPGVGGAFNEEPKAKKERDNAALLSGMFDFPPISRRSFVLLSRLK